MWGELVPSKIFNPPFLAGHSVSYSYICGVCLEWVNGVGFFLYSFLKFLFGWCAMHMVFMYVHTSLNHNVNDMYNNIHVYKLNIPIRFYTITLVTYILQSTQ